VGVDWEIVPNAQSYNIYRRESNDSVAQVGSSISTQFIDGNLVQSTRYFYAITAVNGTEESAFNEIHNITTLTYLTGYIVNENGVPLIGITVALEDGTNTTSIIMGAFELATKPGEHTLTISGSGIRMKKVQVDIQEEGTFTGPISTTTQNDMELIATLAIVIIAIAAVVITVVLIVTYFRKGGGGVK